MCIWVVLWIFNDITKIIKKLKNKKKKKKKKKKNGIEVGLGVVNPIM